ncbi:MAG TPA: hypothetical protein VHQ65_15935 [Thermoanaerobaculia bacterium]|nr:hypothetical protein [Thermoanaerobaculia bacterium]
MTDLKDLKLEDFSPRVGDRFHLDGGDDGSGPLEVELAEASALGSASGVGERRQPFRLIFHGPPRPALAQRIYRLEHHEMGSYDLFLVPIAENAERRHYEAVFT